MDLELTVEADLPVPAAVSVPPLRSLVVFALTKEERSGPWEIGLLFTTDARIQSMHREFMNVDSPTDIMTFPYEFDALPSPGAGVAGGDIVISAETAAVNAEEAGWGLTDELFFLTLHGVLHILGWDDTETGERASMLARQLQLLQQWRDYTGEATG